MKNKLLLLCFAACLASSCKKDNPVVPEENDPNKPVNVLKDNSGFTQVYNASDVNIDVNDFSVEANDNLNVVYFTAQNTQQDILYQFTRETKNLKSNEIIPLPQYGYDVKNYSPISLRGDDKSTGIVFAEFKPYSNFWIYGTQRNGNTSFTNTVNFGGDATASISNGNPLGTPTLGYYYPSLDVGIAGQGYYGSGVASPSYLYKVVNLNKGVFNNGSDRTIIKTVLESRYAVTNKNGSAMQFDIRANGVIANETNPADVSYSKKTGEITFTNALTNVVITRHYSADGKILVLLIKDTNSLNYWEVSYNFETSILTKLVDKTILDYGAAGSDVDCDEFGNIYYTGIADNGKNNIGVSIYKKDKLGVTTLIGADSFLKFGEIIKLKSLYGKVYFALKGKITGSVKSQISIIKQN
jgi:hypothetical protein